MIVAQSLGSYCFDVVGTYLFLRVSSVVRVDWMCSSIVLPAFLINLGLLEAAP